MRVVGAGRAFGIGDVAAGAQPLTIWRPGITPPFVILICRGPGRGRREDQRVPSAHAVSEHPLSRKPEQWPSRCPDR
jgi:hypothetical protein